jgi:hypothetical protein
MALNGNNNAFDNIPSTVKIVDGVREYNPKKMFEIVDARR